MAEIVRRPLARTVMVLALFGIALLFRMSCAREDIPVSPNAKTAAPAVVPGEDSHFHGNIGTK